MRQFKNSKFIVALVLSAALLASCSAVKPVTMPPVAIKEDIGKERLIQADKMVVLALQYHDQAGFERCSDLFVDAAEIYRTGDSIDDSKKAPYFAFN